MKKLLLTLNFSIFILMSANAQDFVAKTVEYNMIYRGYDNEMIIGPINSKKKCIIVGDNCTVTHIKDNTYIVKASSASIAYIKFQNKRGITRDSLCLKVSNLPTPELYLGSTRNSKQISTSILNGTTLSAKYDANIPVITSFEVVSWECPSKDGVLKGSGDELTTEFKDYFRSLESGTAITLFAKITTPDGAIHTISGQWYKL